MKDALGWGIGLWLIGYVLGFVFFFFLPASIIGWAITPIGVAITLWVLLKKVHASSFGGYLTLAIVWTIIAIFLDYIFIVQMLHPADGYYKPDVYLYYALTLALPIGVGFYRRKNI